MSETHCDHCGLYAGGCRCDDAFELEEELAGLKCALFLAVQRLGGHVEFTTNEIDDLTALSGAWELLSWSDPATAGLIVQCRKPKKEPSSGS